MEKRNPNFGKILKMENPNFDAFFPFFYRYDKVASILHIQKSRSIKCKIGHDFVFKNMFRLFFDFFDFFSDFNKIGTHFIGRCINRM